LVKHYVDRTGFPRLTQLAEPKADKMATQQGNM